MSANGKSSMSSGVLVDAQGGVQIVLSKSELTRLNYFDGKFLRADDLAAEQDYLRALVRTANRAGGSGVVHGFDPSPSSDAASFTVTPGLAIDGDGRALLLPISKDIDVAQLVSGAAKTTPAPAGKSEFSPCKPGETKPPAGDVSGLYLLTVGFAELACGEEEVYGNTCADPCSGTTQARYVIESVVFRAVPLLLALPDKKIISLGAKHLRSRVASAYFTPSAFTAESLLSASGLASDTWCLGAQAAAGGDVPLAVFQWTGGAVTLFDAWTARRERIDAPPRRYWAHRMAMRGWAEYLAQILQFQCQLSELLGPGGDPHRADPCSDKTDALRAAQTMLERLEKLWKPSFKAAEGSAFLELDEITALRKRVAAVAVGAAAKHGFLVDGGIVELPPAGYLPVDPTSEVTVNQQVRDLVGQGLDLRFCIVRPDEPAHALEMRQHMDRISLLDGLAGDKPKVDILVPNGRISARDAAGPGLEFTFEIEAQAKDYSKKIEALLSKGMSYAEATKHAKPSESIAPSARGAGRVRSLGDGGGEVAFAGVAASTPSYAPDKYYVAHAYRVQLGSDEAAGPLTHLAMMWELMQLLGGGAAMAHKAASTKPAAAPEAAPAAGESDADQPDIEIDDAAKAENKPITEGLEFKSVVISQKPARTQALYGYANIDGDPFSSSRGGRLRVEASVSLAVGAHAIELSFEGPLDLDGPPEPGTGADQVHVSGSVRLYTSITTISGDSRQSSGNNGTSQFKLYRTTRDDGSYKLILVLFAAGGTNEIKVQWDTKLRDGGLSFSLGAFSGEDKKPVKTVTLAKVTQHDGVLESDNAHNRRVQRALEDIEGAVARFDRAFRERAGEKLWPPSPDDAGRLDVFAGLDWVLFARRRTEDCACETTAKPKRRFEVYVRDSGKISGIAPEKKTILDFASGKKVGWATDEISALGPIGPTAISVWRDIGVVEFSADGYVISDPSGVRLLWQKNVSKTKRVHHAAIGMVGKADADWIELQRLIAFEQAAGVTHPGGWTGKDREVLTHLDLDVQKPGTDGSILLDLGVTDDVAVYRVNLEKDAISKWESVEDPAESFDPGSFAASLGQLGQDGDDSAIVKAWDQEYAAAGAALVVPAGYQETDALVKRVEALWNDLGQGMPNQDINLVKRDDITSPVVLFKPYFRVHVRVTKIGDYVDEVKKLGGDVGSGAKVTVGSLPKVGAPLGEALFLPGASLNPDTQFLSSQAIPGIPAKAPYMVHAYIGKTALGLYDDLESDASQTLQEMQKAITGAIAYQQLVSDYPWRVIDASGEFSPTAEMVFYYVQVD